MYAPKFIIPLTGSITNDELLTGAKNTNTRVSLFYPIIFGLTSVFAIFSALTIVVKRFIEREKDKNLVKNITIMIEDRSGEAQMKINNNKHNNPIICSIALIITTILFVGYGLFYITIALLGNGGLTQQFWLIWVAEMIFKTILPMLVIYFDKNFRTFIRRTLQKGLN